MKNFQKMKGRTMIAFVKRSVKIILAAILSFALVSAGIVTNPSGAEAATTAIDLTFTGAQANQSEFFTLKKGTYAVTVSTTGNDSLGATIYTSTGAKLDSVFSNKCKFVDVPTTTKYYVDGNANQTIRIKQITNGNKLIATPLAAKKTQTFSGKGPGISAPFYVLNGIVDISYSYRNNHSSIGALDSTNFIAHMNQDYTIFGDIIVNDVKLENSGKARVNLKETKNPNINFILVGNASPDAEWTITVTQTTKVKPTASFSAKISGTAKVGKKVTAKISNPNVAGQKFSYKWTVGKKVVSKKATYKIAKKYKGEILKVKITSKKADFKTASKTIKKKIE